MVNSNKKTTIKEFADGKQNTNSNIMAKYPITFIVIVVIALILIIAIILLGGVTENKTPNIVEQSHVYWKSTSPFSIENAQLITQNNS